VHVCKLLLSSVRVKTAVSLLPFNPVDSCVGPRVYAAAEETDEDLAEVGDDSRIVS